MSTRGYSAVIDGVSAGGGVPLAGDFDIYLDVAAGDDANGGTGWADAFLTWQKAMDVVEQHVDTNPSTEIITIYVDNSTGVGLAALGFTIAPNLPDRVRLNVVCPTDRWERLQAGTVDVAGAGITAEAGDDLANVVIVGFVVAVTDVGKTLRLTRPPADPNFGEILTATILNANVGTNSYTVSVRNVDVPAFWDADALTIAELFEANSVLNGTLVFSPKCGLQYEAALAFHKNWLFGIRANHIIVEGNHVAMAACECRTAAGATPDGTLIDGSSNGTVMRYITAVINGIRASLSDARARTWGIFGTTATLNMCLGNACQTLTATGDQEASFAGYVVDAMEVTVCGHLAASRFRCGYAESARGGQLEMQYFRVQGTAQRACIRAEHNGTYVEYADGYVEELAQGQAYIALSEDGAMIKSLNHDFELQAAVGANAPLNGWVADGARMDIEGVTDAQSARIQGTLLWSVNEGDFEVGVSGIDMTTARPGLAAATDIVVHDCSRMTVDGAILKGVPNTIPACCLDVDDCSSFVMKSGAFTHGNAPADWTASYTALGLIHVGDDSRCVVGALTDGAVGAGAGIAIQVRRKSSLWFGANSAITGAATTKVGVLAAAAFPAGAVLNDLPPGAGGVAGTEELCVVGLTASP